LAAGYFAGDCFSPIEQDCRHPISVLRDETRIAVYLYCHEIKGKILT
jgi:hypothetical protein